MCVIIGPATDRYQSVGAELLAVVYAQGASAEGSVAFAVLAAMAWLADDATGRVRKSSREVAESARISAVAVRRIWPALVAAGDLEVVEQALGRAAVLYQVARATGYSKPVAVSGSARTEIQQTGNSSRAGAVLALELEEITNSNQRAKKRGRASFDEEFAIWWEKYPRKVARAKALEQFTHRRREGVTLETLTTARDGFVREMAGREPQFIAHGATFLGKTGRWSDDWNVTPAAPTPDWNNPR